MVRTAAFGVANLGSNPRSPAMNYKEAQFSANNLNSGVERLKFGDPHQITVIRFLKYHAALLDALDDSEDDFVIKCTECGGSGFIESCSNKFLDDWDEDTCDECGGDGWISPSNILCRWDCALWEMTDVDDECFGGRILQELDV